MEIVLKEIEYEKILKNINININSGMTGIIGENGSGKSLLLKIMANEIEPSKGEIKIDNFGYIDCTNIKKDDVIVFDYLKQIMIEKKYRINEMNKRINDSLIMVGLENSKTKKIKCLSSSELVLLSLASILIYNPKVLIIDEPFIYLDEKNLKKIMKIFRMLKLKYNKILIIATNKIDTLHKIVDNIYVLHKGKIVMYDNKYNIFKEEKELKKYNLLSPDVVSFSNLVLEKKNIKIGYRDEINDLIKDIYRYVK